MSKQQRFNHCVGIDVGKEFLVCRIGHLQEDGSITYTRGQGKFANGTKGFTALLSWATACIPSDASLSFVLEASGVYHEEVSYFLHRAEQYVVVLVPRRARQFAESIGIDTKNDSVDAAVLARLGLQLHPRAWQCPDPQFLALKRIMRYYHSLVEDLTAARNRREAHKSSHAPVTSLLKSQDRIIAALVRERIATIKSARQLIKSFRPALRAKLSYLRSIPGIGEIIALTLVAETDGFALMESKRQIASYAGLDVREHQSGKTSGRSRISKRGNSRMRKVLYMGALTAANHNKPLKTWYEVLKAKKATPQIAVVGVMRKLLVLAFVIWKTERPFDPEHEANRRANAANDEARTKDATSEKVAISLGS